MAPRITRLLSSALLVGLSLAQAAAGQSEVKKKVPERLPVYEVVKRGATSAEAEALAKQLGIPSKDILSESGAIAFIDPTRFLSLPEQKIPESKRLEEAIETTSNKDSSRKITPSILNVSALRKLHALPEESAMSKAAAAFKEAKLTPQFGKAIVGHDQLSLYSFDGKRNILGGALPIDTQVTYRFTEPGGYPLYGPGAQTQVTFDAAGHVSRLFYATRTLRATGSVHVIPQEEANEHIARLFPPNTRIMSRLVYFAPPLSNSQEGRVGTLIPWYAYIGIRHLTNPRTGVTAEVKSKIGFMPATDDRHLVPLARISAEGGSHVHATVSVEGGRPPYRYIWGGSSSATHETTEPSIDYTPQIRVTESLLRDPAFNLHRDETLSVTVIDANGISAHEIFTVPAELQPVFPEPRGKSDPSFGSENPGDPLHWVAARIAWNAEMSTPGGGATLSFDWLGDNAWPGDFIRPTPAGTLVPTPWVYGDADFSNWGVDTADIVLDNADGWSDGTVLMQPGAPAADYATASISTPVSAQTVSINGNGYGTPASYSVNYNGSWGPIGPNDTLEWLLLDDCDMLDLVDGSGLNVAQRWGPAFGGLHVLTGFASLGYGDGPFEGGVADNVLGIHGPAQTIVQSWFNSAAATSAGTAAAMGPAIEIMPDIFICDSGDFFWGKGPVGPTLVPASYPPAEVAFWYMSETTPMEYLF